MKYGKIKKGLKRKIDQYNGEIEETMDDINTESEKNILTIDNIIKRGKALEYYSDKINILTKAFDCL